VNGILGVKGQLEHPTHLRSWENPWSSRYRLMDEKLGFVREFRGNVKTREDKTFCLVQLYLD
jgi:hypothetical protein